MTARSTPWSTALDEALADGDWHDGVSLVRDAEKKITPGVALREATRDLGGRPSRRPRTDEQKIRAGKRSIIQSLVHARVRAKSWEASVWPIPPSGWQTGGWQLRDLRVQRKPITVLAAELRLEPDLVRQFLAQDPPLRHRVVGRITYVDVQDIHVLRERVAAWRAEEPKRRSAAAKRGAAIRRDKPRDYCTMGELAARSNMAPINIHKVLQDHPELEWTLVGRGVRLPKDKLPQWDAAVEEFRQGIFQRRSQAMREVRARMRMEAAGVPTFADPDFTETYSRYRAGESGLREEVYRGFRDAFERADAEAGDAEGGSP